ncbi:bifunctional diaminohydroxyphosphoribosylaminopyrimidine deaminase/5-amino-6-(5-phosphoribosylamino)uracil reductase RibD [Coxiella burnetii]|uniref:bifunctional diaminohydroxyphosphoribosylaminopyrimidine deaminase/5-amino-6-(5-phosphoribosylamino)uracil reductase RibD n=1 Tax=Coxiella burnetii TaxID=777 RepID=UPI0000ED0281|nr:bifunctional diaminohydroxyphosphoribosylaminopyrimidine deaminase/5-amino-6-(5-phosphoribosylamino)uracil reductase RibD [Coxiella burnetii]ACJ20764.1 diaminohydroxyphosphoribosylaminopyrimidine deaminase [Coxiella burnetii CbuK_Q154]AIT63841.1 Riboflavin biosynthesis protein RibD [Coxiella burnetii str. Namibia]ATN86350.1 bifunctional diaminohydroxyphosphoribosylaminopyrimidine deaminase/5-amino-6-(5-phosphoribosylamino)uracil reductase [Coxiella burnetii str. Schperling]EAX32177.1 ribofla
MNDSSLDYLKKALSLAEIRRGFCAPNPSVGAVVVKDDKIISTGFHKRSGLPHAEVEAIKSLGDKARGAALYVTLEPCCHFGKTPPCTDLIIQSGIKAVYYGLHDPNLAVCGKGIEQLQRAGVNCFLIELPEINAFYESYRYWIKHKRPWVTAKLALSLDGKIAGNEGKPVRLTGEGLRQYTHERRKKSDALLTTINTILTDDPKLNVRLQGEEIKKPIYILDTHLRLPLNALIHQTAESIIVFHGNEADKKQQQRLMQKNIRCIEIARRSEGLDLNEVLDVIGNDGIHDLWIEAGGTCFQSFLKENLINRALIYIAPKILGSTAMPAFQLPFSFSGYSVEWRQFGEDVMGEIRF